MVQYAERHLEGNTLVVRIPMRFQRRGGRKRIIASDGSEIVPTSKPVSEIGDAENVSRGYVSQILPLALLAPDIVERSWSTRSRCRERLTREIRGR